jgi:peptide-methionine (R)-S-oxide reductase
MTTKPTDSTPPSKDELRKRLTDEQYRVTQLKGTEAPYTGEYHATKEPGTYVCVCCNAPLFESKTKFDSGTGWPSFYQGVGSNVSQEKDVSMGMQRTEVLCKRCGSHLGHVFDDAPDQPTGLRFCINSAALRLNKPKS